MHKRSIVCGILKVYVHGFLDILGYIHYVSTLVRATDLEYMADSGV